MLLLIGHLFASLYMLGTIWFVQVVHYPLMRYVPPEDYPAFEGAHMRRTTWVVAPAMLLELGTGLGLLVWNVVSAPLAAVNLGLIGALWLSTFLAQAPTHEKLRRGFDPRLHRYLVRSNWLRTLVWSLRAVLLGLMLYFEVLV
jgi:hypothetical protein